MQNSAGYYSRRIGLVQSITYKAAYITSAEARVTVLTFYAGLAADSMEYKQG
jgi:hypothetical protein